MNMLAQAEKVKVLVPEDTLPGIIFVIVVIGSMIAFLFRTWYVNYGPGAEKNPNAAKFQN